MLCGSGCACPWARGSACARRPSLRSHSARHSSLGLPGRRAASLRKHTARLQHRRRPPRPPAPSSPPSPPWRTWKAGASSSLCCSGRTRGPSRRPRRRSGAWSSGQPGLHAGGESSGHPSCLWRASSPPSSCCLSHWNRPFSWKLSCFVRGLVM